MAVKAKAEITLASIRDVKSTTRYYLLQSSTAAKPAKPSANPPGGSWVKTEPSYTAGSTNSLYFTDLTVFSDNTYAYSDVSLSSSYEAAKTAYNKAVATQQSIDGMQFGGRNLLLNSSFTNDYDNWSNSGHEIVTEDGLLCGHIAGVLSATNNISQSIFAQIKDDNLTQLYTVSADIKLVNYVAGSTNPRVALYVSGYVSGQYDNNGKNAWLGATYVGGTIKGANSNLPPFNNQGWVHVTYIFRFAHKPLSMNFYVYSRDWEGDLYYRNIKLERGNTASDWSPAPEDLEARLDNAESAITQQADQISLRVSKGAIISEINQTAETVTINANRINLTDVFAQDIEVTGVTHSTDYVRTGTYADSGMGIEFNTRRFATPNFAIDPSGNIYARGGLIALFNLGKGSNVAYNLGEPDKFLSTDGESGRYQYDAPYLTAGEDGTAIYNIPKTATSAGETYTIGKLWVQVFEGSSESESEDVDQRLAGRVIYLRHDGTTVHESDFSALVYHPDGSLLGNTFALNAEYLAQSVSVRLEVDLANGDRIKVQRQYGTWQALYYGSNRLMGDPNGAYFGTDGLSIGEDVCLTPDGHATVGALTVKNNIGVAGDVNSSGTVRGKNCIVENEANDGRIMIRDAGGVARYALWMSASNRICVGNDNSFISTTIRGGGGITLNNDTTVNGHVTAAGDVNSSGTVRGKNYIVENEANDGHIMIRDTGSVARQVMWISSNNRFNLGSDNTAIGTIIRGGGGITLAGATTISGNLSNTGSISAGSSVNATTGVAAGNGHGLYVKNASGSLVKLFWLTGGNVCTVGSDSYATSILGKTITSSKTITVSSDRRLKRDITVLDGRHQALFDRLCPVSYRLREDEDGKEHIGLVAQEVQEALEQSGLTNSALVQADSEGMLSIGYTELIGLLVDEVQTLKAQMQQQETTIEALTRRLDALERGN